MDYSVQWKNVPFHDNFQAFRVDPCWARLVFTSSHGALPGQNWTAGKHSGCSTHCSTREAPFLGTCHCRASSPSLQKDSLIGSLEPGCSLGSPELRVESWCSQRTGRPGEWYHRPKELCCCRSCPPSRAGQSGVDDSHPPGPLHTLSRCRSEAFPLFLACLLCFLA